MPRVRKGAARARKHKKILKSTRGQIGAASRRYRVAREAWLRAGHYATVGRKLRKRDFRQLWITRISAACRQRGLTYSRFMNALAGARIALNRKVLADIAVADPAAFDEIVAVATGAKPGAAPRPAPAEAPKAEQPKPEPEAVKPEKPEAEKPSPEEPKAEAPAGEKPKPVKKKKATRKKAAPKTEAAGAEGKPKATKKKKATTKKKTAAKAGKPKPKPKAESGE